MELYIILSCILVVAIIGSIIIVAAVVAASIEKKTSSLPPPKQQTTYSQPPKQQIKPFLPLLASKQEQIKPPPQQESISLVEKIYCCKSETTRDKDAIITDNGRIWKDCMPCEKTRRNCKFLQNKESCDDFKDHCIWKDDVCYNLDIPLGKEIPCTEDLEISYESCGDYNEFAIYPPK